jgi:hypothetical protein
MNPFVDGVVIVLFILFMVFILGGYHKTKATQREVDLNNSNESNQSTKVNELEEFNLENSKEK